MYDPRGLALSPPIEREVHHHVYDVVGIGFGAGEVVDVRPLVEGDRVVCFDIIGHAGEITRARNLVVASRPTPALPDGIYSSKRIWHTSEVPVRVGELASEQPGYFVVAGAGDGAVPATAQIRDRFPDAEICSIAEVSRVTDVLESEDDVLVVISSSGDGTTSLVRADAIVFATGYEPADPGRLLRAAVAYCKRDTNGDLRIGPDGRLETTEHVEGTIYVQAAPEFARAPLGARAAQPSS